MNSIEVPADTFQFAEFCAFLEKLKNLNSKQRKEQFKILTNFFNDIRSFTVGTKNSTIFPILRLLLPKLERERCAYNLKESKLGRLLVDVLSLDKKSNDAQKLLNFRSVPNSKARDSDFAGVAHILLKNRIRNDSSTLNIGRINQILDKIATAEVGNKGPILDQAMSDAIKNLNAEQIKWFLRIILKDLKLGIGDNRILAAFHPDAPELYNNYNNLAKVCEELEDGETRPPEAGLQVFLAVSPMLSERLDVTHCEAELPPNATYIIETKFDGERFQMHMENGKFEYFSRKGYPSSDKYGKDYSSGLLTPYLKDCFSASITSLILDGEMMGWHKYLNCMGSKGMAFDIKKITESSKFRPCYCVFDVLYYNGKSLVGPPEKGGMPLADRLILLDTMFTDVTGVILHSERTIVKNIKVDIVNALNKAIDDQDEGIVVKDTQSYYLTNRRNAGWYKIKPEYTENAMTDLDLVIIGADEAEKKRQGRAKSFLVACADKLTPDKPPHRWLCVGRVATGFTYEERENVCTHLEKHWVSSKTTPPPPHLVFNKEKCDFWILPEHSIVLEVRATELIRSTHFGTDYTLRFPRVVKIREDKPVNDVLTLDQFNALITEKNPVTKLGTKRINEDQILEVGIKSRKKRTTKPVQVAEHFRTQPSEGEVEVTSQALRGRKLCVLSADADCSKAELKRIIESHAGKYVEIKGPDTWCCIAGTVTFQVRSLVKAGNVDIISTSWLRTLPPSDKPCLLSPLDMLSITSSTRLALSRNFDKFGDSYTDEIDEETLRKCLNKMENEELPIFLTKDEMLQMDHELFGGPSPYSFLRPCSIHFMTNNPLFPVHARMYGAQVCEIHAPGLTHVVVGKESNIEELKTVKESTNALIVSEDWFESCLGTKTLVSAKIFLL